MSVHFIALVLVARTTHPPNQLGGRCALAPFQASFMRGERESTPHTQTPYTHTHTHAPRWWVGGWVVVVVVAVALFSCQSCRQRWTVEIRIIIITTFIYIYIYIWMDGLIDAYLPILLLLL